MSIENVSRRSRVRSKRYTPETSRIRHPLLLKAFYRRFLRDSDRADDQLLQHLEIVLHRKGLATRDAPGPGQRQCPLTTPVEIGSVRIRRRGRSGLAGEVGCRRRIETGAAPRMPRVPSRARTARGRRQRMAGPCDRVACQARPWRSLSIATLRVNADSDGCALRTRPQGPDCVRVGRRDPVDRRRSNCT